MPIPMRVSRRARLFALSLSLACSLPAAAQPQFSQPWTSLHAGLSDSPRTDPTYVILLSHMRPVANLPFGLDLIGANLGSLGGHHGGGFRRATVWFGSVQAGYDFGPITLASGIAAVSETTTALSSGLQFHSQAILRLRRVELAVGHLSNAGLRNPNRGETYLSVGFRF